MGTRTTASVLPRWRSAISNHPQEDEMTTVFANGKSILHKGHGQTQLAMAPDVCKTPSPGGPVPIPYPNMSPDSNLTDGAATVVIAGNPVGNTGSTLSRSNGDEAGTA